jgi:2,3-bisphosphoglycerate-independent phosphoglycerate mutase
VVGRYYAMDRDGRWDRTRRAYDALVHGAGARAADAAVAVRDLYERGVTDEFIEPVVLGDPAEGRIADGDAVVFFNFRPDRARQLTRALIDPAFAEFDRGERPPRPLLVQMTRYAEELDAPVAYPPHDVTDVLADVLAAADMRQLHIAETEKYPHVTYFFDGGAEHRRPGEDWLLCPSPRDVATYDERPQMSAPEVTARFCEAIASTPYAFALLNFANPDMVGHTGVIPAAVAAVEAVDRCLEDVLAATARAGGVCLVTADHGNAETMLTDDGHPHTAHTTNPVPLVVTAAGASLREGGRLGDLAPTALELLALDAPAAMTGRSLLVR